MDDDHILAPDHLARCLEAVKNDPDAIWTTGEIGYLIGECSRVAESADQLGPSGVGEAIRDTDDNWGSRMAPQLIRERFSIADFVW